MKSNKTLTALAAGLIAGFLLASCSNGDEGSQGDKSPVAGTGKTMPYGGPIPRDIPPEIANAAAKAPAPARTYPAQDPADEGRFLQMTLDIVTGDGRDLKVSALAYCETYDNLPQDQYAARCAQYVKLMLDFNAQNYMCFEGAVPAAGSEVRNHPGLPQDKPNCAAHYGPEYAASTPEMVRTGIELSSFDDNFYTVTKIEPR